MREKRTLRGRKFARRLAHAFFLTVLVFSQVSFAEDPPQSPDPALDEANPSEEAPSYHEILRRRAMPAFRGPVTESLARQLGLSVEVPEEPVPDGSWDRSRYPCGPLDPDCSKRLLRLLSGFHFLRPEVAIGGQNLNGPKEEEEAPMGGRLTGFSFDSMAGDLDALVFEAYYYPDLGGTRIRFKLADSEVLFFCRDAEDGSLHPPGAGAFNNCIEQERIGVGGTLIELQGDTHTGRFAARWAEVNFVLNLLGNGNGLDYLNRRLLLHIGSSVETIWHGRTPGTNRDQETIPRGLIGISGMIRSDDKKVELAGSIVYRPGLSDLGDFAVEAHGEIAYNFLMDDRIASQLVFFTDFSYWSEPWNSIGTFASDREKETFTLGVMLRVFF